MKGIKRIACMLLALTMILSMACAWADGTGTITISNVSKDVTYEIYRLLDLGTYDEVNNRYAYTVNEKWVAFFATSGAQNYFEIVGNHASWKETTATDDDTVAAFAKLALAYAKENGITPVKSSTTDGAFVIDSTDGTGTFSSLDLGYYLVDSTMGALCGLTTIKPNGFVNAKNGQPTLDKTVKEDETGTWGDRSTADVGEMVDFRVIINVHAGAQNYVLHDQMSEGLTFVPTSVKAVHGVLATGKETDVPTSYYTVVTDKLAEGETNANKISDDCTFEIRFSNGFCEHLDTGDWVTVYYSATLNEKGYGVNVENVNETWMHFGEGNYTTHDKTFTTTHGIDIIKTDGDNKLIDGATFKIYSEQTGGTEIAVKAHEYKDNDPTKRVKVYVRDLSRTEGDLIVVKDGAVRVEGLDDGVYWLEEVNTPEGYTSISGRQKFVISGNDHYSTFTGTNNDYFVGTGIQVVNRTGALLPETGGVGTTLFYVFGGVLAVAAVVLLVTKKRMGGME